MCKSHGGGTAASVRVSRSAEVSSRISALWGLSSDTSGISVEEQLNKLAQNKLTDIIALRTLLSDEGYELHIGNLKTGSTTTVYDIEGTVQSKSGTQKATTRAAGVSPFVQELHKAEQELVQILKLMHEVTGDRGDETDVRRIRIQTAREAARLAIAFPGMTSDQIAMEVAKRA